MKSDIISEAIKKIDTDLVRDAAAYVSGAGAEQAKQTRTAAAGKRWKKAVAVAATVFLLVGGITAGIILGIRKPGGSTSGIPGTQPDPVPGASASLEDGFVIGVLNDRLRFIKVACTPKIELSASGGTFRALSGPGNSSYDKDLKSFFNAIDNMPVVKAVFPAESELTFSIRLCNEKWFGWNDFSYVFDIYEGQGIVAVRDELAGEVIGSVQLSDNELRVIREVMFPTLGYYLDEAAVLPFADASSVRIDLNPGGSGAGGNDSQTMSITDGVKIRNLGQVLRSVPVVEADNDTSPAGDVVRFRVLGEGGGANGFDINIIGGTCISISKGNTTRVFRMSRASGSELEMLIPALLQSSSEAGFPLRKLVLSDANHPVSIEWDCSGDGKKDTFCIESYGSGMSYESLYYIDGATGNKTLLCRSVNETLGIGFAEGFYDMPLLFNYAHTVRLNDRSVLADPFAGISAVDGKPVIVPLRESAPGNNESAVLTVIENGEEVNKYFALGKVENPSFIDEETLRHLDTFIAEVTFEKIIKEDNVSRAVLSYATLYDEDAKSLYRIAEGGLVSSITGGPVSHGDLDTIRIDFVLRAPGGVSSAAGYYFCGSYTFQERGGNSYMEFIAGSIHSGSMRSRSIKVEPGTYARVNALIDNAIQTGE
ncbi:MAG: hypothetical protein IKI42_00555 [Clostridia bacterium]|nr:hypothetical protein [Clostridia bacterium]